MSHIRKFGFLLLIVSLLVGPSSGLALAQDSAQDGDFQLLLPQIAGGEPVTLQYSVSPEEQDAARVYGNSFAARVAAEPVAMPFIGAADLDADQALPEDEGEAGFAPSGLPALNADEIAQRLYAAEWARIEQDQLAEAIAELQAAEDGEDFDALETDGTKGVFTSFLTNYYSQSWKHYPYRAVGKLYITGGGYCSASVISPYNIVVTAAHCVYDRSGGGWYPGWSFVPADRKGSAPYGVWTANNATILTAYANTGSIRYDVALVELNYKYINSGWRAVSYLTGYLGRSWDKGYIQHLHAQGYPSNLREGRFTYTCAAESFKYSTDILGMGCNMTYGSSGGPWIRRFHPYKSGSVNYVNSVVSGVPAGQPIGVTFFGPRFSSNNIVPLCSSVGC